MDLFHLCIEAFMYLPIHGSFMTLFACFHYRFIGFMDYSFMYLVLRLRIMP